MKQIALAVHNYHDDHQKLPNCGSWALEAQRPRPHWLLLPYLEQGNVIAAVEADSSFRAPPVPVYRDPTDPTITDGDINMHNRTSYAFNVQIVGAEQHPLAPFWRDEKVKPVVCGPLPQETQVVPGTKTLLGVTDGTSSTILLAQRFGQCYATASVYTAANPPHQALYAPDLLPQLGIHPRDCISGSAQTVNGSILVALCDGSVRSVSSGGVQSSWFAASTPSGGEVLGDW